MPRIRLKRPGERENSLTESYLSGYIAGQQDLKALHEEELKKVLEKMYAADHKKHVLEEEIDALRQEQRTRHDLIVMQMNQIVALKAEIAKSKFYKYVYRPTVEGKDTDSPLPTPKETS